MRVSSGRLGSRASVAVTGISPVFCVIKRHCGFASATSPIRAHTSAICAFGCCYAAKAGARTRSVCGDGTAWRGSSCASGSDGANTWPCIAAPCRCRRDCRSAGAWTSCTNPPGEALVHAHNCISPRGWVTLPDARSAAQRPARKTCALLHGIPSNNLEHPRTS